MNLLNTVEVAFTDSLSEGVINQFPVPQNLESLLKNAVNETLLGQKIADAEISIAIVGDAQIHEINRQYLDHDYETDVITFDLGEDPGSRRFQGEIVCSAETALRIASELEVSPESELILYAIHGALHLAGFDDHDAQDREKMREAEKVMMDRLGFPYRYDSEDSDDQ